MKDYFHDHDQLSEKDRIRKMAEQLIESEQRSNKEKSRVASAAAAAAQDEHTEREPSDKQTDRKKLYEEFSDNEPDTNGYWDPVVWSDNW